MIDLETQNWLIALKLLLLGILLDHPRTWSMYSRGFGDVKLRGISVLVTQPRRLGTVHYGHLPLDSKTL